MKPVPVIVAELMFTAAVPVEVNVSDLETGVLTWTLPKATLVALMLSVGVAAFNCNAKLAELLLVLAASVTAWAEVTDETVAVNAALEAFAGIVTDEGTETAVLLLDTLMFIPPVGAGVVSVTVQASVPAPVMVALLQERAASAAFIVPVPVRATEAVWLVVELLAMVRLPIAAPDAVGVN